MIRKLKVSHLLAVMCLATGTFVSLRKIHDNLFSVRYITCLFDSSISLETQQAIEKQVRILECNGKYQVAVVMSELLRIFPDIKQLDIRTFPYNTAEMSIDLPMPLVRINESRVLTEAQTIIPACYYAEYCLERLPKMQVTQAIGTYVSDEMMEAIHHSIKEEIFERFAISLKNEYEWYLQDKNDPLFTVCCNASCLPVGALHALYEQVKETTKKRSVTKTAWTADVRFDHQIVLSRYKGGRNGKRV